MRYTKTEIQDMEMQQAFHLWLGRLNRKCIERLDCELLDLPDQNYHEWWEAGCSVYEAINFINLGI